MTLIEVHSPDRVASERGYQDGQAGRDLSGVGASVQSNEQGACVSMGAWLGLSLCVGQRADSPKPLRSLARWTGDSSGLLGASQRPRPAQRSTEQFGDQAWRSAYGRSLERRLGSNPSTAHLRSPEGTSCLGGNSQEDCRGWQGQAKRGGYENGRSESQYPGSQCEEEAGSSACGSSATARNRSPLRNGPQHAEGRDPGGYQYGSRVSYAA